jgi:cytochrome c oxidase subunit 2
VIPPLFRRIAVLVFVLGMFAVGCGGSSKPSASTSASDASRGEDLAGSFACQSCHTTDGSKGTGPTWKGLAGSTVTLADGRHVIADRDYLVRSILAPDADTVAGFPKGLMAAALRPYHLSRPEADALANYIESLK